MRISMRNVSTTCAAATFCEPCRKYGVHRKQTWPAIAWQRESQRHHVSPAIAANTRGTRPRTTRESHSPSKSRHKPKTRASVKRQKKVMRETLWERSMGTDMRHASMDTSRARGLQVKLTSTALPLLKLHLSIAGAGFDQSKGRLAPLSRAENARRPRQGYPPILHGRGIC